MAKTRFVLNRKGVAELLKSKEMGAVLKEYAGVVASRAGEGYATDTHMRETRLVGVAYAATKEAGRDNRKNNTLLKALN